jgi:CheY-like chemotaxis protein
VLLVEDEPTIRRLMAGVLEKQGFRVLEARNGLEAEDVFGRHGREIDLLITDVKMPFVSGIELVEAVRAANPALKVLYVTGYPDDRTAQEPQLIKPFTREAFLETLAAILSPPPGAH